jgi:hypothetical protein
MVRQSEDKERVLQFIRPLIWLGPFLTLIAGCALLGSPFQEAIAALLAFCAVYLGTSYVAYRRVCRIAGYSIITATGFTIPSILAFLATLRLAGGRPFGLVLWLGMGYVATWGCGILCTAGRGIGTLIDGYRYRKEIDLDRGFIDLTKRAKMWDAFLGDRSVRNLMKKEDLSPREKRWFQKWGWLIGLLIAILPLWRALNAAYIDETSPVAQNLYGILVYYVGAVSSAFAGGYCWGQSFLWRRWERENGKPMLIKYLEDRYTGKKIG